MLSQLLADHVALHQALGFKFRTPGILLRNFVAFAEHRGEHVITTATVREWALQAPSPEQRRNRLLAVRRFALSLHAEDSRHEVPSADLFGRASRRRRTPYIYSPEEVRRLIDAAQRLGPNGSIRSLTYATMFGLIAATGMRVFGGDRHSITGRDRRRADHCTD
jgi:integrase